MSEKSLVSVWEMTALGYQGLGEAELANQQFQQVLKLELSHQGALVHLHNFAK